MCLWVFLPSFLYCQALCNICLTVSVLVSELRAWLFVLGCCLNWTAGVSVVIVTKCFQRPAYFFYFCSFHVYLLHAQFHSGANTGALFVKWTRNHIYSRQTIRSLTVTKFSHLFFTCPCFVNSLSHNCEGSYGLSRLSSYCFCTVAAVYSLFTSTHLTTFTWNHLHCPRSLSRAVDRIHRIPPIILRFRNSFTSSGMSCKTVFFHLE